MFRSIKLLTATLRSHQPPQQPTTWVPEIEVIRGSMQLLTTSMALSFANMLSNKTWWPLLKLEKLVLKICLRVLVVHQQLLVRKTLWSWCHQQMQKVLLNRKSSNKIYLTQFHIRILQKRATARVQVQPEIVNSFLNNNWGKSNLIPIARWNNYSNRS